MRESSAAYLLPDAQTLEGALLTIGVAPKVAQMFCDVVLPFTLRPNQLTSLQAILAWPRCGVFDSPRTGKTISMILGATYFAAFDLKSVFVMPPILLDQFQEEVEKVANHGLRLHLLTGTPSNRARLFEKMRDGNDEFNVLAMSKEVFKLHVEDLILNGFSALFFDECHMGLQSCELKTPKKQHTTYGATRMFVDNAKEGRLVLSTGTPIKTELGGTYPIISLKNPEAYSSKRDFDYTHITWRQIVVRGPRGERTVPVPDSDNYMQKELLQRNLWKNSVRATQLEVLGLKTPNVQVVPVRLSNPHQALYRKTIKEKIIEFDGELIDARNASLLRELAQQMITNPYAYTTQRFENNVVEMVKTLMDTVGFPKTKVFMFANYNSSVELLAKTFAKLKPAVVYGPNGATKNRAEIKRFQEDKNCALGIANPESGGVGITLGHVCQTVIFVEPVSSQSQFEQASSRIILAGQENPVVIYLLKILDTLSPKAIEKMLGRAEQVKETLKDKRTLLDELLGKR